MIKARSSVLSAVFTIVVIAVAIAVSLLVTPMQQTSAAGQTIRVGAAAPTWSWSGPGELDLFGQRLPTAVMFTGPVRPRVQLSRISLSRQLSDFVATAGSSGSHQIESALVHGWWRYLIWQVAVMLAAALVLAGAIAGWRRRSRRSTGAFIATCLVAALAVDLGAIMVTAYTAPARLGQVGSIEALVGAAPLPPALSAPVLAPAPDGTVRAVVVGDSTAAGLGNPVSSTASKADRACGRSRDAFPVDLAGLGGWHVTNLACSDATIAQGLLGPQRAHGRTIPAQLGSPAVAAASVVVVSVGANDLHWSNLLQACAAAPTCRDDAEEAFFQQQLAGFSRDYLQLLTQLEALPAHPQIVVNLYYNPFAGGDVCAAAGGITAMKQRALTAKLGALNDILAAGAKAAGFMTADPDFTGHGLCTGNSYVQGMAAPAPFHPTATGEFAIALIDAATVTGAPRR